MRSLVLSLCLVLLAGGCISRPQKQEVSTVGLTEIYLRSDVRWTTPVEKGYAHPVAIAPVRLSHILSRLDVRPPKGVLPRFGAKKDRVPAIATELIDTVAAGVSKALAQADPNQEVVVMAVRETKRWGVFDHDYLTSFVVYARGEQLYFHFNHFEWEIPKRRDDRLPEPRPGHHPDRFELYGGTALARVDDQSVAIDWDHPVFAQATRIQLGPGGEIERREILMESPPEVTAPAPHAELPAGLEPDQLRALADLEDARRGGQVSEAEYRTRRAEILGED